MHYAVLLSDFLPGVDRGGISSLPSEINMARISPPTLLNVTGPVESLSVKKEN